MQAKLAACAADVIVAGALRWAKTTATPAAASTSSSDDATGGALRLPWTICARIAATGGHKLLHSVVASWLRLGHLTLPASTATTNNSISTTTSSAAAAHAVTAKALFAAVRRACETPDEGGSEVGDGDTDGGGDGVAAGAWVLLEALVGQDIGEGAYLRPCERPSGLCVSVSLFALHYPHDHRLYLRCRVPREAPGRVGGRGQLRGALLPSHGDSRRCKHWQRRYDPARFT